MSAKKTKEKGHNEVANINEKKLNSNPLFFKTVHR